MIRKLMCWLGWHEWCEISFEMCLFPKGYKCKARDSSFCKGCKYYCKYVCKHCGKVKK